MTISITIFDAYIALFQLRAVRGPVYGTDIYTAEEIKVGHAHTIQIISTHYLPSYIFVCDYPIINISFIIVAVITFASSKLKRETTK